MLPAGAAALPRAFPSEPPYISGMLKIRICATLLSLAMALPAAAQSQGRGTLEELGRDADRFLEKFLDEFGPALRDLEGQLRSLDQYEPPEILPNGDILIRRKHNREDRRREDRKRDAPDRDPTPDERKKRGKADTFEDTNI